MEHLLTEARNPASMEIDKLSALEFVRLMNAEDACVIPAVAAEAERIAQAIDVTADRIRAGGRLIYVGAGTSGRLGVLDASECPPTFRTPPGLVIGVIAGGAPALTTAVEGAEDHPELAEHDLRQLDLTSRDVVVGIATSGRTPYVCGALAYARSLGAFTVGFSCTPDAELNPLSDLTITPLVGPEVVTGSTRLKAGTATKLVLNMISTGVMVQLGKTYGNLMVDLRATNTKLRARANRIIRHFTGLPAEAADDLLQRSDGEVKTALVAHQGGVTPAEARERLQAAGGQVRRALPPEPVAETFAADLVLGIDGGGTGTVALLARVEGDGTATNLGRGESGPSNFQSVGLDRATRSLEEAVLAAFRAAGRQRTPVHVAHLGLAGAGRPADQQRLCEWAMRTGLARHIDIGPDVSLLLAAGTPAHWGVALVAGTGSLAWGRTLDGRTARSGGWGPLLGDEGSAYALALSALRAIATAADGRGPSTALTGAVLGHLGLSQPNDLITAVRDRLDRSALAALAPLVVDLADTDRIAGEIVDAGAADLAACVVRVIDVLDLRKDPIPLALSGGLLLGSAMYRQRVLDKLREQQLRIKPVTLVEEPAQGAVQVALQRVKPR